MTDEEFYLVDIDTGDVIKRWPCGHLNREEKAELARKIYSEYSVHDAERGLDLRNTRVDERAPWD